MAVSTGSHLPLDERAREGVTSRAVMNHPRVAQNPDGCTIAREFVHNRQGKLKYADAHPQLTRTVRLTPRGERQALIQLLDRIASR